SASERPRARPGSLVAEAASNPCAQIGRDVWPRLNRAVYPVATDELSTRTQPGKNLGKRKAEEGSPVALKVPVSCQRRDQPLFSCSQFCSKAHRSGRGPPLAVTRKRYRSKRRFVIQVRCLCAA